MLLKLRIKSFLGIFTVVFALVPILGLGQVSITTGSATIPACSGYPTAPVTLSNIVINENQDNNISTTGTNNFTISAPVGFQFVSAGSISYASGGNITAASIVLTNSTTITVTISVGHTNKDDQLTISGIQIIATAPGSGNITRSDADGIPAILGLTDGTVVGTLSSSSGTPPTASTNGGNQTLATCATTTTLTGNTPAVGTGNWTVSPAGPTITTPSSPISGVTGLVPGTVYTFTWTISNAPCANSTSSMTVTAPIGPGCQTYCTDPTPPISNAFGYIANVNINGTTNPTGWNGYRNYSGIIGCVNMTQGTTQTISVNIYNSSAGGIQSWAFIDWNGNGNFEASEGIDLGHNTTNPSTITYSNTFTVPCDAAVGNIRIRFAAEYSTDPTGCNNTSSYGEIEDYCITIVAATPPIANAGPNQNITCSSSATLNAAASVPASGSWTLVSGTGTITNPASPTSTVTGMSNGANVFQWTAYGTCATDEATVTINVAGLPNVPVSAGNDIFSCTQGLSLDGSDPAPFTGQWVVISGPNTPTFTPAASANNAQISGLIIGAYVLQWQVNTTSCGVLSDQMTFTFGSLPTPNAGPDQTICPTGAVLNGNDFDGAIGTWSVLSGPAGSGFVNVNDPNTMIYNLVAGSYVLHWTVSGGGCAGGTFDAVTITVNSCTTPVLHGTSANQSLTGCSYTYTDNGGPAGAYSANISQTWTTFCPDNPSAFSTITVNTAGFFPGDYMLIYDSPGAGAPIVGAYYYSSSGSGGTIGSPALGTTITSSTGCLYVQMNSSASNQNFGWTSTIGCSLTQGIQSQTFVSDQNCGGGGGITLCSSGSVTTSSNNSNNPPDLGFANNGCLGSLEGTSNKWAYINVSTDGWLTFQISPAGGQDFDYAVWGPYPGGYSCPGVTLDDPIRCSWAANGGSACPSTIGLGALNTAGQAVLPSDVSEGGFCSATNEGWTYPIYALAGQVYVVLFQNYGSNNSTFGFNVNTQSIPSGGSYATLGCTPPQPLPVELVSFIGEHKDRNNYIYWNTASEHMNDYFTIEKSKDGMTWSLLTSVTGAGFSNEMNHYSTIDENPFVGITYYRLIQTDFDGKKRDYKTIAISTDIEIEDMFSNVFPNPTQNSFYFNYGGKDFNSEIIVNVYNSIGQLVINESLSNFNSSQSMEIDTKDLIDGFYQVEIIQNEKREIKKLSIVK